MIEITDKIKFIGIRLMDHNYFLSVEKLRNERHTYSTAVEAEKSKSGDKVELQKTGKLSKIETQDYLESELKTEVKIENAMEITYTFKGQLFYRFPDEPGVYLPHVIKIE